MARQSLLKTRATSAKMKLETNDSYDLLQDFKRRDAVVQTYLYGGDVTQNLHAGPRTCSIHGESL
eukprot:m.301326 g.301326  ORF g.301326 m.301326 type:complete len:65 (-) comp15879_c0_seq12:437-631(-)